MPSIFTKMIEGQMAARFVWKDEVCFAIMTISPLRPGHVLVIPRKEVDHWIDLEDFVAAHLLHAARSIGKALMKAYSPTKVGLMIAGLEVRHVHIHLVPIDHVNDLDFSRQDPNATAIDLDRAAASIREALRTLGFKEVAE
jgi:histidine triad (HIT) family protein